MIHGKAPCKCSMFTICRWQNRKKPYLHHYMLTLHHPPPYKGVRKTSSPQPLYSVSGVTAPTWSLSSTGCRRGNSSPAPRSILRCDTAVIDGWVLPSSESVAVVASTLACDKALWSPSAAALAGKQSSSPVSAQRLGFLFRDAEQSFSPLAPPHHHPFLRLAGSRSLFSLSEKQPDKFGFPALPANTSNGAECEPRPAPRVPDQPASHRLRLFAREQVVLHPTPNSPKQSELHKMTVTKACPDQDLRIKLAIRMDKPQNMKHCG